MQKKITQSATHPLLNLARNLREYQAIITPIVATFVSAVALIITIRTQPIVDSIRTLDLRVTAIETRATNLEASMERYSSESRNILNSINGELGLIKGELRRIK